jgi:hypothetical protein
LATNALFDEVLSVITDFAYNQDAMKTELMQIAARGQTEAGVVANGIAYKFKELSKPIKDMLFELVPGEINDKNIGQAINVVVAVTANFEYISVDYVDSIRILLHNLAYNTYTTVAVAQQIATHFDKLPYDIKIIIFDLADDERVIAGAAVIRAVTSNYDKLPSNATDLLFKLADKKNCAQDLKHVLETNPASRVPENVKNDLLNRMQKKNDTKDM